MEPPREYSVFNVILEEFSASGLSRLVEMQTRVESGGVLNDFDLEFLTESLAKVHQFEDYAEHHHNYQELAAKIIELYHDITETALNNQMNI